MEIITVCWENHTKHAWEDPGFLVLNVVVMVRIVMIKLKRVISILSCAVHFVCWRFAHLELVAVLRKIKMKISAHLFCKEMLPKKTIKSFCLIFKLTHCVWKIKQVYQLDISYCP
jgi:hypothetical protein